MNNEQQLLENIAAAVKEERRITGESMRKFADKAGLRAATINDIENGNIFPNVKTLLAIGNAIGKKLVVSYE